MEAEPIKIIACTKTTAFKELLKLAIKKYNIKDECCFVSKYDDSLGENGDLLIWNLPLANNSVNLLHQCQKKAECEIVMCGYAEAWAALSDSEFGIFDDYWLMPMPDNMIMWRFYQVIEAVKQKKLAGLRKIYLDTVIDSAPSLIWFKDLQGKHLKVNKAFCYAVGKTKEQIEGRGHYYIWDIPRKDYEQGEYVCLETEEIVMEKRRLCVFDEKVKSKQGMRQFKTYKAPLFNKANALIGTLGMLKWIYY